MNSAQLSGTSIKSVVIVGGGTSGWMTAAATAQALEKSGIEITLIESEAIGTIGVGEATVPSIRQFHGILGIDEDEILAATNGTYKLGVDFVNWGSKGNRYFHPFGAIGRPIDFLDFHHYWNRLRLMGDQTPLMDHCLVTQAAYQNKFTRPINAPDNSVFSSYSYAIHFEASLYAKYLRKYSEARGVKRIEALISGVNLDAENGDVVSVTLNDGRVIAGDFFIDCSGFRAIVSEGALKTGFEDWSHWLFNNKAWATNCEDKGPLTPYTRATAHDAGWQWRIPLQSRIGTGHVYCDAYTTDQEALDVLMDNLDGKVTRDPFLIRFQPGRRKLSWNRNCVAIGLAGGFVEPLESTTIYFIQTAIFRFLSLFPRTRDDRISSGIYNRLMQKMYEETRDFLILHYTETDREDTAYWKDIRQMSVPDSLKEKIDAYSHRGWVQNELGDLFGSDSWHSIFTGQNVLPESYNIIADNIDVNDLRSRLTRMRAIISQAATQMPDHRAFLRQHSPYMAPDKSVAAGG